MQQPVICGRSWHVAVEDGEYTQILYSFETQEEAKKALPAIEAGLADLGDASLFEDFLREMRSIPVVERVIAEDMWRTEKGLLVHFRYRGRKLAIHIDRERARNAPKGENYDESTNKAPLAAVESGS